MMNTISEASSSQPVTINHEEIHPTQLSREISHSLSHINNLYTDYYKKLNSERRMNIMKSHVLGTKPSFPKRWLHTLQTTLRKKSNLKLARDYVMVVMVCVAIYLLYRRKSKAAAERMAKQFSLIEILIAISIIVTFSGLTSAVYSDKLIDSKISYTKIELNQILQHIYLYYTMNGRYPVSLTDLENIKSVASLEDPWNQPYIYVPPINWTHILELLQKPNLSENELTYHMECLQGLSSCLGSMGQSDIDPRIILVESSKNPVLFSFGYRKPIFVGSMEDYQTTNNTQTNEFRERIQLVAQWIKLAREKSVGLLRFQSTVQQLQGQLKE